MSDESVRLQHETRGVAAAPGVRWAGEHRKIIFRHPFTLRRVSSPMDNDDVCRTARPRRTICRCLSARQLPKLAPSIRDHWPRQLGPESLGCGAWPRRKGEDMQVAERQSLDELDRSPVVGVGLAWEPDDDVRAKTKDRPRGHEPLDDDRILFGR